MRQVLSDYLVGGISDDPFFREINAVFEPADAVRAFCFLWLQGFQQLKETGNAKLFWERVDVCSPLHDALGRINRMCRSLMHLLCLDLPANISAVSDDEVTKLANYKGQQILEGAMRRLLTDPKTPWCNEVNDLVKKGGSSALVGSKVENLEALLLAGNPSPSQFRDMVTLLSQTESAVRARKLRNLRLSFYNYFKKHSIVIRSGQQDSQKWWCSEAVDALLDGLALVHDFPGALDERKQLQSFRTSQVKQIAQNDLVAVLRGNGSKTDFDMLSTCLQFCGDDAQSPLSVEVSEEAAAFFVQGLSELMDKVS